MLIRGPPRGSFSAPVAMRADYAPPRVRRSKQAGDNDIRSIAQIGGVVKGMNGKPPC